jgi:hypothetical protein
MPDIKCPLCDRSVDHAGSDATRSEVSFYRCRTCGEFRISRTALAVLKPEHRLPLSCASRRITDGGGGIEILSSNIEELIKSLPRFTPPEKLDNLLQHLAESSTGLARYSTFDIDFDYPLLIPSNLSEPSFLMNELFRRGYVSEIGAGIALTMSGWERLEEIRRLGHASARCFVAMWFDESMNPVYDDAIKPAIVKAGYDPLRIDKLEHSNRIDDEIIGQIRRSRFMVADFTGQRSGVYFEAGLMQGIGRNVIWMCRNEVLTADGGLHFDVRQFNFIAYVSVGDARTRLYHRILALEGQGPLAVE